MTLYHLNEAQRVFIRQWLADNQTRPAFGAYDKANHAIARVPVTRKPTPKAVPCTDPGYGGHEIIPKKSFDATKHLPAGWAIVSMHDSGGNHKLDNAGGALMRAIWNCWSSKSGKPIDFSTPLGIKISDQLLANNVTLP